MSNTRNVQADSASDSPFSTVEDPGLVRAVRPLKKFRLQVCNDFAGRFEQVLEAESDEQARQYLINGLTRGITIEGC